VQFVEREPFCQRVLAKHWPGVPIHDDICTYTPAAGTADLVVGGFPCQDISQAGAGIKEGTRSGLFYELMRVIRLVGPRFVVLENVAAITHRGLDIVLGELAEAGFDAEWACIPASAVGACHRRDRWWCVAYARGVGQLRGQKRDSESKAGVETPLRGDADGLGLDAEGRDAAHPLRERLEGPHELGEGRTAWPAAPARLSPDWSGYASEPLIRRGDDGFSGRVDRLKALGNAVVPQVAMIPLQRVLELAQ
jgi:DNA (cytosine-5)-methyltransferase 1